MSSSLFRSFVSNWFGALVAGLIGFFVSPILVHGLGSEHYGLWALVVSVTSQLIILDIGIRFSLLKFVAEYRSKKADPECNSILSSASLLLWLLAIAGFCGICGISPFFSAWFHLSPELQPLAQGILIVSAFDGACDLAFGKYNGTLSGYERYDLLNIANVVRLVLNACGIILVIHFGFDLWGVAISTLFVKLIYVNLLRWLTLREEPSLNFSVRFASREGVKKILSFGLWASLIGVAGRVINHVDTVVVGFICGTKAVTSYALAYMIVNQFRTIAQASSNILIPRFSELFSRKDNVTTRMLLLKWISHGQILTIGIGAPLLVFGSNFMELWMGTEFKDSISLVWILCAHFMLTIPAMGFTAALYARNNHRIAAGVQFQEALCNVVVSIILAKMFGLAGVAWGTTIPALVFSGIILPRKVSEFHEIKYWEFIRTAFVKPLPLFGFHIAILWALSTTVGGATWSRFILSNVLGLSFLLVFSFLFLFSEEDRGYVMRRIAAVKNLFSY